MSMFLSIILFLVVAGLLYWLVTLLPLPEPFPTIIRVVVIIALIFAILGMFMGYTPVPRWRW